ncbi:NAD(P)/FAD-dependent oxidoreductase [Vallicoccus soli]|uniref:NAD(P)/FAD-dependent oxidoreductase n=1 Tax=Vallicoccus soli TaxID=2339232 RepID=A0A3A3YR72_9ACTN|nr:NAD(P)/FAD-dependent oxidoreductase [Vallicoccus soli]RJK93143.1 NAD(P)/FAD-dependent oxidoreductase [Vallicoccus soli]
MRADLVVVGAGPVGLGTAVEAALAGMDVVVVDPRPGPVDKACGEGLMPPARDALARLGVEPPGREFHGIAYVDGRGPAATARFRSGPGLGVRRTALSGALAERASALGVRRVAARAAAPLVRPGEVEVAGVRAPWAVAADGLHSPLRRALGLDAPVRGRPRYGLRRHWAVAPWSDAVEVHWATDAEAYVTPVADDLVGVAVLCGGGRPYEAWLDRFPALRERLAGAEPASAVRGAGPLQQRARRRVDGRVLLAGDAAGYVDALTGEGIAVGLIGARELVRCLVAGRPHEYERAWRRATGDYRRLTRGLLWASSRPAVRRRLVPAARRAPWAFAHVVDRLARP